MSNKSIFAVSLFVLLLTRTAWAGGGLHIHFGLELDIDSPPPHHNDPPPHHDDPPPHHDDSPTSTLSNTTTSTTSTITLTTSALFSTSAKTTAIPSSVPMTQSIIAVLDAPSKDALPILNSTAVTRTQMNLAATPSIWMPDYIPAANGAASPTHIPQPTALSEAMTGASASPNQRASYAPAVTGIPNAAPSSNQEAPSILQVTSRPAGEYVPVAPSDAFPPVPTYAPVIQPVALAAGAIPAAVARPIAPSSALKVTQVAIIASATALTSKVTPNSTVALYPVPSSIYPTPSPGYSVVSSRVAPASIASTPFAHNPLLANGAFRSAFGLVVVTMIAFVM
ncbi:hypothetical protein BC830DRAFT_1080296 [Chytriomyces sp. MP71]|nr:hypothetical protein BC830DRAFT_1080296 [Chytriomyces sp. MP71]